MIIYSEKPFNANMLNLFLMEDSTTGGYIYVNKEVFAQAVSLEITYDKNHDRVIDRIKVPKVGAYFLNKELINVINHFKMNAPEPINMLAGYLIYTQTADVTWSEDMSENMQMAYGFLHMFSNFIDFYRYSLATEQTRTNLDLPNHVLKSYKTSWEDLTGTLADKVVIEKEVQVKEVVTRVFADGAPYTPIESIVMPVSVQPTKQVEVEVIPTPTPQPAPAELATPVEEVKPEEPKVEETKVEEPKVEEPKVEEPKAEEHKVEEPKQDTPAPNDPNIVFVDPNKFSSFEERMKERERQAMEKANAAAKKNKEAKKETFGDSGALQISEAEIAADTLKILDEFDV